MPPSKWQIKLTNQTNLSKCQNPQLNYPIKNIILLNAIVRYIGIGLQVPSTYIRSASDIPANSPPPVIQCNNMAPRACALLFLAIATVTARECIELTLPDKSLLTDSILNGTILKLAAKNESFDESGRFNIVELWERFPKVVVPRNGTSEQCRRDSQLYLDSLDRLELWALKSKYLLEIFFLWM